VNEASQGSTVGEGLSKWLFYLFFAMTLLRPNLPSAFRDLTSRGGVFFFWPKDVSQVPRSARRTTDVPVSLNPRKLALFPSRPLLINSIQLKPPNPISAPTTFFPTKTLNLAQLLPQSSKQSASKQATPRCVLARKALPGMTRPPESRNRRLRSPRSRPPMYVHKSPKYPVNLANRITARRRC